MSTLVRFRPLSSEVLFIVNQLTNDIWSGIMFCFMRDLIFPGVLLKRMTFEENL